MNSISSPDLPFAEAVHSEEEISALRAHVKEIIEAKAFKGSARCGRFLAYVVDGAIAHHFDALKERVIGVEVFGRAPAYDTNEDAIVRVTASDVRKRLIRYYSKEGRASRFHIDLPVGSYIPRIVCDTPPRADRSEADPEPGLPIALPPSILKPAADVSETVRLKGPFSPQWRIRGAVFAVLAILSLALNLVLWQRLQKNSPSAKAVPVLPWSAVFSSPHPTHLILSDPDIFSIQILTHNPTSVSDYANHRYLPENVKLSPELQDICNEILSGDKASGVDAQIAAEVAVVAKSYSRDIDVQGARSFQFSNLRTDDNFIFLGSPSSNPWFSVFQNQLDFQFVGAPVPGGGLIRNLRPRAGEQATYVPTARGGATGESFAVAAVVGNPNQSGQVLLMAGLNREGTQAVGRLMTDPPRLSTALEKCGIAPNGPLKHFEMLLRVDTLAGSPSQFDVLACHVPLSAPAS